MKINGRSTFYSWLLEMALFLRVETGEKERKEESEVRWGEKKRECPMLVGMVTWPGEMEPGRKGGQQGGGAFVSRE